MDQFIEGIYHYCNGFCPACALQHRCAVFAETKKLQAGGLPPNPGSPLFDQYLRKVLLPVVFRVEGLFREAEPLLRASMGLSEEEVKELRCRIKHWVDTHVLIRRYTDYSNRVMGFLQEDVAVKQLHKLLEQQVAVGIIDANTARASMQQMQAAMAHIYWNHEFTRTKLRRALLGKQLERQGTALFPNDSDGSAKTALVAIEVTMHAWQRVYGLLPMLEDIALHALGQLEGLRAETRLHFPLAMTFKRPGFDDGMVA